MPDIPPHEDTIAAIATPVGQAGIGIVRVSGPRARPIAERIFRPRRPAAGLQSHRLYLGHLVAASGEVIDEVLLSFMKAPRSYTREDVVEINCHSGYLVLSGILQTVLELGARLARPGEFTFRAFANGRIDLTQAEAVVDLINAHSERGLELASRQAGGALGTEVERLRQVALGLLAHAEVGIDFPEEESEVLSRQEMAATLEKDLLGPIEQMAAAHVQRRLWLEGIRTVIVGRTNVGKSSLLNRLLDEERAIVTPIPGTTRDVIESFVHIEGLPLRLMDTAGFRKTKKEVERLGIRLTEEKLAQADLCLVVIDQSVPLSREDHNLIGRARDRTCLIVINKIDLPLGARRAALDELCGANPAVRVSALTGEGIDELRRAIRDRLIGGNLDTATSHLAPNLRHREALGRAAQCFRAAATEAAEGSPLEIIAMEMSAGLDALGEIIGKTTDEGVLDRIFGEFCLGK